MTQSILIVEDEPLTSRLIAETVVDLGYSVAGQARTADEARTLLHQTHVDLILMDINILGPEDGLQLSKTLTGFPIIYISAYSDMRTLSEASDNFPYGYVVKPFKDADLVAALQMAMRKIASEQPQQAPRSCKNYEEKIALLTQQGIKLSKREKECLRYFYLKANTVVLLHDIKQALYQDEEIGDTSVRELITRLRKKLGSKEIETIYAKGYILKTI